MTPFKFLFRVIQLMILVLIFFYFKNMVRNVNSQKIPIGVVFEQHTDEIQTAFKFGMVQQPGNRSRLDFQLYVDVINTADAFKLSRLTCNQFARGVISMLGAVSADSFDTIHSYLNTFQMPFVTPWFPEKVIPPSSGLVDYAVSLRPDYHRAVIDTIAHYNWKNIIYIYDSHDGLLRLQQLFQHLIPGKAPFRISFVKRVSNGSDAVSFLRGIEMLDRWSTKYVILDSSTALAKEVVILHVRDVHLGRRNYHYFLTGLVMDDRWERDVSEFGAINITGFRLLDHSRKFVQDFLDLWKKDSISAKAALMFDAVQVLVDSIIRLLRKKPDLIRNAVRRSSTANATGGRIMECNPKGKITPYEHGEKISRMIKKTDIEGLSGPLRFNEEGHRRNFSLQIVENTVDGDVVKVAVWYDHKGLIPVRPKMESQDVSGIYDRNKTYVVTSVEEPPYLMRNLPDTPEAAVEAYRGFCVELANMIAEKLEIKHEIRLVKDGKYGNEDPKIVGGWDGLVGELVRKEADMAIAPLIITMERETVIDFSRPFLAFNLKHAQVAAQEPTSIFSFLHPLSTETWICILASLVLVSGVLYSVSRFSPHEWKFVSVSETQSSEQSDVATTMTTVVNDFSFWNSIWYSLSSFMQQGSDISPRSVSGRIVSSVWWFFTLIVVCSYTANLASYLTVTRIAEPIHSYNKIATCPQDTTNKKSTSYVREIQGNEEGWFAFLLDRSGDNDSKSPCEMVVSSSDLGFKDFGVGFPKGSKLRDGVDLALMALKNDGELNKLVRKWFTKTECDLTSSNQGGSELTLGQVAGIFYVLLFGLAVALAAALFEFFQYGRAEARRSNLTLRAAFLAKSRAPPAERKPATPRRQRDQDREWNGDAFSGQYYSTGNQIGQEETALHTSFTQV